MDPSMLMGTVNDPRIGRPEQLARVEEVRLVGGRAEGVRAFEIDNFAGLQLTCIADRCLDIARLKWKGVPLCWESPNGVAAPAFYDPHGDGFLKSFFGGLVTTCGLTNFGPGGSDQWGEFALHGRIDHIPAENVVSSRLDDEPSLSLSGTMRETKVFGADFRLDRQWRISATGSRIELHDRVTNEGGKSWPHMLLYHCNAGFPLLDASTEVFLSHTSMRPRDEAARRGEPLWNRGGDPDPDFEEEVFIHKMSSTEDSAEAVGIIANRKLKNGLALRIRFDSTQLPNAFTWRMLGYKTYVFAIEPANCDAIEGRGSAQERGVLPMLEPGETRRYDVVFDVLQGRELDAALPRG